MIEANWLAKTSQTLWKQSKKTYIKIKLQIDYSLPFQK